MFPYLTIETIREELQDREPGDNSIDCDLFFSDKEIEHAMNRAATMYNAVPPIGVDVVSGRCLPADSPIFLDAVLSKLYGTAINKLARNVMTWRTGDVTVDLEKTRLSVFRDLKKEIDATWRRDAADRKAEINRYDMGAFGYY